MRQSGGIVSLRLYFASLVFLGFIVVTLATGLVFAVVVGGISQKYAQNYAISRVEYLVTRIRAEVDRELALGQKLVDDGIVKQWMANPRQDSNREQALTTLFSYKTIFRGNTVFAGTVKDLEYWNSAQGSGEFSFKNLRTDDPLDRWFFDSINEHRDFWINVNYDTLLDKVLVWINIKVHDEQGSIIGVAGTGMDLGEFLSTLVSESTEESVAMIINRQGHILAHPDKELTETNARVASDDERIQLTDIIELPSGEDSLNRLLVNPMVNQSVQRVMYPVHYQSKDYLAAFMYMQDLEWFGVVLVEGFSVLRWQELLPMVLGFLFLLGLLLILVLIVLQRQILKPLVQLDNAAASIISGDYSIRLPDQRSLELQTLSMIFNKMASTIQGHRINLESLITKRTEELQESQKRLLDSIAYAQLIQQEILPKQQEIEQIIGSHCIVQKPLDTVGGDFYFTRRIQRSDGSSVNLIAVVDCTGHGVPGAIMTMLVYALLNQITQSAGDKTLGTMMEELHELVKKSINRGSRPGGVENGLDLAALLITPVKDTNTIEVEFFGAGLPMYYQSDARWREIKASPRHLGFLRQRASLEFSTMKFDLPKGTIFCLVSDGILDLPGGPHGFGLGSSGLIHYLDTWATIPINEWYNHVLKDLSQWQASHGQRDDLVLFVFCFASP